MPNKKINAIVKTLFLALAVSACSLPSAAQTQTWQIDPNHTASQFSVRHMGISTVRGEFEKTSGSVTYDPSDLSKTSIEATIDASSVNTRVQMRDNDVRGTNFLDVAKYPTITFKSTHVESAGSGKLKAAGNLTLHGVTKQVVLDVDGPTQAIKDQMGNMRAGASATTKINRSDFGMTAMSGVVGDEIRITLDIEMTHAGK